MAGIYECRPVVSFLKHGCELELMSHSDKTLGILGLGRLGQRLVPVARAFGLKILTWSPNLTQQRVDMIGQNIGKGLPLLFHRWSLEPS